MSKALLILNLGSPDSTAVPDVRKYLNQFLMDERVIDYPYLFRLMLVRGIITPFRAPKSAEAYKTIWTEKGSPLKVITDDFKKALSTKVQMPVAVAMRYANPTIEAALQELEKQDKNIDELLIAPMYPHFAMSSYETAVEHAKAAIEATGKKYKLNILKPFYSEPAYISALAESIKPYLQQPYDAVLFSYHGLPIRHLQKSDPTNTHCYASRDCCEIKSAAWDLCYKHQVKETTRLVTEKLGIETDKVKISFQSRLGSGWVQPFTDVVLQELPKQGIKKLLMICPAFVADCLETLEEIKVRGNEIFMENGGETFEYAPCLNTQPQWVNTFADYCNNYNNTYQYMWQ
jgi:ferrochelatase